MAGAMRRRSPSPTSSGIQRPISRSDAASPVGGAPSHMAHMKRCALFSSCRNPQDDILRKVILLCRGVGTSTLNAKEDVIVNTRHMLLSAALTILVASSLSCTGETTVRCSSGQTLACHCNGSQQGIRTCQADGVWTNCACDGDGGITQRDASVLGDGSIPNGDGSTLCSGVDCSNHGTCQVQNNQAICQCDSGYHASGLSCVDDNDPCSGQTCSGHGTCQVQNNQPVCQCNSGYHVEGLNCIQNSPCDGVDCSNHGTCQVQNNQAVCQCDSGYHVEGLNCIPNSPCDGVDCSNHGTCQVQNNQAVCQCDSGYHASGLSCVDDNDPCGGQTCSGHGTCYAWSDGPVCACNAGYTPSNSAGLDCVPTSQICVGGSIDYDVDGDGTNETRFDPNADECTMYELINLTRAAHDNEGSPECHKPLAWDVLWSAHARNHCYKMQAAGHLYHEDYPGGQNCAMGCGPSCEMNMYMTGTNEGHCPPLSHHCNIMRCRFGYVGVGYVGTWNTQNFH